MWTNSSWSKPYFCRWHRTPETSVRKILVVPSSQSSTETSSILQQMPRNRCSNKLAHGRSSNLWPISQQQIKNSFLARKVSLKLAKFFSQSIPIASAKQKQKTKSKFFRLAFPQNTVSKRVCQQSGLGSETSSASHALNMINFGGETTQQILNRSVVEVRLDNSDPFDQHATHWLSMKFTTDTCTPEKRRGKRNRSLTGK